LPAQANPPDPTPDDFRAPRLIFWIALALRILTITIGHTYRIRSFQDHFQFGWEMGRVARALATGYGYADPFVGHTGPTAWVPPLYPLLMAAVFKIAGVYTALSAWILLAINSVFSAAIVPAIYEIAGRCYNRKVAVWSAWLWALYPAALQYAVHWVWEMSLTTMLFSFVLVLALRMRGIGNLTPVSDPQAARGWLLFGLLWGLIALSNSSLLLFLPACGVWILLGTPNKSAAVVRAALACIVCLAVIAPWIWRNWITFHVFIPMRSNLGAEFYTGSGPGSNGFPVVATLPLVERDPDVLHYEQLGEIAWVREQGTKAKAYISAHPAHYALITIKRIYFYWVSVPHPEEGSPAGEFLRELNYCFLSITGWLGLLSSLRNRTPGAWLFAWAFLLLPLTYYFVTVNARFRHPLEPLIAILTVYLFQSARPRRQETP
jgi:4-amino-4-deoxy-L-arabinose transferase-like glycosyltransferase